MMSCTPLQGFCDPKIKSFLFTPTTFHGLRCMGALSVPRSKLCDANNKRMFIFGLGYTGTFLAHYLRKDGWHISGTCRSNEKLNSMEKHGFEVYLFDPTIGGEELKQDGLMALSNATHILSTIPPAKDTCCDPVLESHVGNVEYAALHEELSWLGYLSSTGVYGDWQGKWVDEESEPVPFDNNAEMRLEAERAWLLLGERSKVPVHVFRLGGIYGPGRSALEAIRNRKPLTLQQTMRTGRRFTSRVHVADICQVISASINSPYNGRIYNVVDDDPASRADVLAFASNLITKYVPAQSGYCFVSPAIEAQKADNVDERGYADDASSLLVKPDAKVPEKRVSNRRIKTELRVQLRYPSYRSGLEAILKEEGIARS